jgi:hypothetical protein
MEPNNKIPVIQMKFMERNTISSNVTLFLFGIVHFLVLVSIMSDFWIGWKTSFWIDIPILLIYLFAVLLIIKSTFGLWKKSKIKFAVSTIMILANLFLLHLNYYIWMDLFDGKTNALLP